jgi:hypothetical protein
LTNWIASTCSGLTKINSQSSLNLSFTVYTSFYPRWQLQCLPKRWKI